MAELIKMPKMSDTMTEGVIAAWHKKVGDKVKSGDLLAEVETDKATMEMESYEDGTLLYIAVEAKNAVPIDGVMAIVGKDGENIDDLVKQIKGGGVPAPAAAEVPKAEAKAEAPKAEAKAAPAVDLSSFKAEAIRMPTMSDTMTEGTIVAWHKKVGDTVKSGELLAEVATDKATMEMESYENGTLLYIGPKEGEAVEIDGLIAIIGEKGTDVTAMVEALKNSGAAQAAPAKAEEKAAAATTTAAPATAAPASTASSNGIHTSSDERAKISPLARKIAAEKGVDLKQVKGSGDHGRVIKRDIENFKPEAAPAAKGASATSASAPSVVGQESFDEFPVSQMRKVIAKRLTESLFTAPHFYLTMEINMDKAIEARASINEVAAAKISFNDLVIRASAAAIRKHPMVNASWLGDKIRVNHHIHIGVAIAVEEGLLVPVVRFADSKSLSQISAEVKDLAGKAKGKKLTPAEMSGNTFTISNLGMFGIDEFTSIINTPDACILSVGGIKQTPIVKNGQIVIGNIMKLTLACDHRVADGAVGSAFLQTLKSYLEDPVRILA